MKMAHGLDKIGSRRRPVILAAGFFDGVHLGHRRLIRRAMKERDKAGGEAWALTFDAHPMKVLRPEEAPPLIASVKHKLRLLESLGVDGCVLIPFTRSFSRLDPESFIAMLKKSAPSLRAMVVGKNWTFGRGKRGTARVLQQMARRHGFMVRVVSPVCWRGKPISSTRIRRDIVRGRIERAARMLGRPVSIFGSVTTGHGRGTKMGVPTANIDLNDEVRPPDGVYAARAIIDGRSYDGVVNLGTRPTVGRAGLKMSASRRAALPRVLELHVFGMRRDLYRKEIEVFFIKRLRNERRFASMEALKRQIENDIKTARARLAERVCPPN